MKTPRSKKVIKVMNINIQSLTILGVNIPLQIYKSFLGSKGLILTAPKGNSEICFPEAKTVKKLFVLLCLTNLLRLQGARPDHE